MNKENIQKAINYLEANYDDISTRFDMEHYRGNPLGKYFTEKPGDEYLPVCDSVGCLVGHLTAIDADNFKDDNGRIHFNGWSKRFFFDDSDDADYVDDAWYFMFGSGWSRSPETNTLQQGINRMKCMLEHEQPPEDWEYEDTYE